MQNPLKKTLFALYVLVIVCMAAATVVEKYSGTDFVRSNVYGAWWFSLLWAVLTAAGIIYFLRHRCKSWSGIAVSFGFGDVNEMVSAGAKAVIDDIRQLPDVLSKLFD